MISHLNLDLCCVQTNYFHIRWMDDLGFYILFNSISVISGRWANDKERLCAMELCLRLRRFHLERGSNLGPFSYQKYYDCVKGFIKTRPVTGTG